MVDDAYVQEYAVDTEKVEGFVILLVWIIIIGYQIDNGYQYHLSIEGMYYLWKNCHKVAEVGLNGNEQW